jgi:putative transposase
MFQRHPIQNSALMFITTNVAGRKRVFSNPAYARQAIETLYKTQNIYPFLLFGFVIMPDHCHFLLNESAPATISNLMKSFKIGVGYDTGLGAMWQSRFHLSLPDNSGKVLSYIHLNPVRAGLVENPEDYPWSSASGDWDVSEFEFS